ncbi:hypothetical protein ACFXJM_06160 [Streptomyces massasporeus]
MDATGPPPQAGAPDTVGHGDEPHAAPASGPMAPGTPMHHIRRAPDTGRIGHPGPSTHPTPSSHPGPSTHLGPAPADHAPGGRPDGVLGNRSLADSGSSRHGDVHAVTPGLRAPMTVVAGLVTRTDAADARSRHQDIPLFPG